MQDLHIFVTGRRAYWVEPVPDAKDDERRGHLGGGGICPDCGSPRAADQRYCLSCGARLGALPRAVAEQLNVVKARAANKPADAMPAAGKTGAAPAGAAGAAIGAAVVANATPEAEALESQGWPFARSTWMPSPRAASVAVVAMLALGVAIGSATSQLAQSAGLTTILLEPSPKPPPEEEPAEEFEEESANESEVEPEPEAPVSEPPATPPPGKGGEQPGNGGNETPDEPEPPKWKLQDIKHVFVIMLGENGYEETFGKTSTSPYFSKELLAEGELLPNYYAVAGSDLANQIALIGGQGPTVETALNCPNYGDVMPGTISTTGPEQVEGNGCVYPAETQTLAGQLVKKKLKWKAYVEDMAKGAATGLPTSCRHPALGTPDPSQVPIPGDAYQTYRNPFVYFHSIVDGEECAKADVDLERLAADLKKEGKKFPALAYIVPNACHEGGEAPCEPEAPTGPAAAEETVKRIVAEIEKSPAYVEGGVIVITSSLARQTGEKPDASACCVAPTYINVPEPPPSEVEAGGVKTTGGGGKVGMVLISNFVEPGSVNETFYYNHFSLLRTVEEVFELEPIGYAAEPAVTGFSEEVFNLVYEPEEFEPLGILGHPLNRAISAARSAVPGPGR